MNTLVLSGKHLLTLSHPEMSRHMKVVVNSEYQQEEMKKKEFAIGSCDARGHQPPGCQWTKLVQYRYTTLPTLEIKNGEATAVGMETRHGTCFVSSVPPTFLCRVLLPSLSDR
jgi:hypothetical protein